VDAAGVSRPFPGADAILARSLDGEGLGAAHSDIPVAFKNFSSELLGYINHPAQQQHFEEYLTGLMATGNTEQ